MFIFNLFKIKVMNLKLEKKEDRYDLYDESTGQKIASDLMQGNGAKLSTNNCEAVFNGYDLDELAEEYSDGWDAFTDDRFDAYKEGFKKALQILGDKKFSEKNLDDAISWATINGRKGDITHFDIDDFIQSLQQKSWDVEIVTEESEQAGENVWHKPKLDANGCIIIRRK